MAMGEKCYGAFGKLFNEHEHGTSSKIKIEMDQKVEKLCSGVNFPKASYPTWHFRYSLQVISLHDANRLRLSGKSAHGEK